MEDPRYYTGVDEREFSDPPACDQCGVELYPSEMDEGRCRRCVADALEAGTE